MTTQKFKALLTGKLIFNPHSTNSCITLESCLLTTSVSLPAKWEKPNQTHNSLHY